MGELSSTALFTDADAEESSQSYTRQLLIGITPRLLRRMLGDEKCISPVARCSAAAAQLVCINNIPSSDHIDAQIYQHCAPSDYDDVGIDPADPNLTCCSGRKREPRDGAGNR